MSEGTSAFPSQSQNPSSTPSAGSPTVGVTFVQEPPTSAPTTTSLIPVLTSATVTSAPRSATPTRGPVTSPISYAPSTVEPTLSPVSYKPITSAPTTAYPTMSSDRPVEMPMKGPASLPCRDLENYPFFVDLSIGTQTCIWLRSSSRSAADFGTLCSSTNPLGYGYVICAKTCRRC